MWNFPLCTPSREVVSNKAPGTRAHPRGGGQGGRGRGGSRTVEDRSSDELGRVPAVALLDLERDLRLCQVLRLVSLGVDRSRESDVHADVVQHELGLEGFSQT